MEKRKISLGTMESKQQAAWLGGKDTCPLSQSFYTSGRGKGEEKGSLKEIYMNYRQRSGR